MASTDTKARSKVYEIKTTAEKLTAGSAVHAAVKTNANISNTVGSLEVFDAEGNSLGFVAVYAANSL